LLDNAIFKALPNGALDAAAFHFNANSNAAVDADDRIIYNHANGYLWYDTDGLGGASAIKFAVLVNKPVIDATDFLVI
jgi:Ca2+-binding RTX toxin-like protein